VLTNLITNAIKFSANGKNIMVNFSANFLSAVPKKSTIIIEVIDEGIGMTKEECSRLFSRYFKTEDKQSREMNPNGHGLGLNISKEISQILKGDLICYSRLDIGS
jgi:signal transduction histidine kinase